jgi:hypothetical protein
MPGNRIRETDLYAPVKALLVRQGYEVKGEVGHVDIVARRGDEDPVLVELKTGFSLSLVHQAIERLRLSRSVYVAVPRVAGRQALSTMRRNTRLCRYLGIGLMIVRPQDGAVDILCDPGPYRPPMAPRNKSRLLREFERRKGDPNEGGSTRRGIVTAYRQDALRCLNFLESHGPAKAAQVAKQTGVAKARRLMADNHYGWFERVENGIYGVSRSGRAASSVYSEAIRELCC